MASVDFEKALDDAFADEIKNHFHVLCLNVAGDPANRSDYLEKFWIAAKLMTDLRTDLKSSMEKAA